MLEPVGHPCHGERRRVRHEEAVGRDDPLEPAEDLALDGQLLEDGFEDEVAVRVGVDPGSAGHDRAEEAGLPLA